MPTFNAMLFEQGTDLIPDILNGDANADLAGDWLDMTNKDRAYLMLIKPAGSAGDDLSIVINQATDNAGAGSKGLNFDKLWHKIGTMNTIAQWTAIILATPTSDLDLASVNGVDLETDASPTVILVEILADNMDSDNEFNHIQVTYEGDDISNALIINSHWLLTGDKYAQAIPLSAIG